MSKRGILYLWSMVPYTYLVTYTDITSDDVANYMADFVMQFVDATESEPLVQEFQAASIMFFFVLYQLDSIRKPPEPPHQ